MALVPPSQLHKWHFRAAETAGGTPGGGVPVLIAVCEKCGLIRAEVAAARREARIELGGDCPVRG